MGLTMFESQYNDEMEREVKRLEAKKRATAAGYPEWDNACKISAAGWPGLTPTAASNADGRLPTVDRTDLKLLM